MIIWIYRLCSCCNSNTICQGFQDTIDKAQITNMISNTEILTVIKIFINSSSYLREKVKWWLKFPDKVSDTGATPQGLLLRIIGFMIYMKTEVMIFVDNFIKEKTAWSYWFLKSNNLQPRSSRNINFRLQGIWGLLSVIFFPQTKPLSRPVPLLEYHYLKLSSFDPNFRTNINRDSSCSI